jgi:hypothetical protein
MTRIPVLLLLAAGWLIVGCGEKDTFDFDGGGPDSDTDTDTDSDSDYTCTYECVDFIAECLNADGEVVQELTCPGSQVCCDVGGDTDTGSDTATDTETGIETEFVDLTPPDGFTEVWNSFYSTRGYWLVPAFEMELIAAEWWFDLTTSGALAARLYNGSGDLLASGDYVPGEDAELWYRSEISYTLSADVPYVIALHGTGLSGSVCDFKHDPTQPFDIPGYFTDVQSKSNDNTVSDEFPVDDNNYAPFIRIEIQ